MRPLTLVLVALLVLDAVLAWLALQATFIFVEMVWRGAIRRHAWHPLIAAHVRQFEILRAVQASAWLLTALAFVGWLHRARAAARAVGARPLRYSAGQMLAGFLIPGVNLVRPLYVLGETWQALERRAARRIVPPLVAWWWCILVAGLTVDLVARALGLAAGSNPLDLGRGLQLLLLGAVLQIAAAALGVALVVAINRRQRESALTAS